MKHVLSCWVRTSAYPSFRDAPHDNLEALSYFPVSYKSLEGWPRPEYIYLGDVEVEVPFNTNRADVEAIQGINQAIEALKQKFSEQLNSLVEQRSKLLSLTYGGS